MEKTVTALLVDDDPAIRRLLSLVLAGEGIRVCAVADGIEALEQLPHCQPDVIVLDIQMPRMDGPTFLSRIREEGCSTPVLVLSALGLPALAAMDADDYLPKPFSPDQFASKVRRLVA